MKRIAVCGSNITDSSHVIKISEEIGEEIAKRNDILVCGGLGGVMEAASRGCKKLNGVTVGILPSSDKSSANDYIDIPLPTSLGKFRNFLIVNSVDGVIAIEGKWGTLSEISMSLNLGIVTILIRNTGGVVDWLCKNPIMFDKKSYLIADSAQKAIDLLYSSLEK